MSANSSSSRTKIVMVLGVREAVLVVIVVLNYNSLRNNVLSKTSHGNSSGHEQINVVTEVILVVITTSLVKAVHTVILKVVTIVVVL